MILFYYIMAFGFIVFSNLFLILKTNRWITPYSILSVFYFIPILFSTMRLSGLQGDEWHRDTITILAISVIVWGVYPFVSIWKNGRIDTARYSYKRKLLSISGATSVIVVLFSLCFIFLFLIESIILTSRVFPILAFGDLAHETHAKALPVLSILTRSASAISSILFLVYAKNRRKIILILIGLIIFLPLTRGSRLDTFIALIVIGIMNADLKVFDFSKFKTLFLYVPLLIVVAFLLSLVGVVRSTFNDNEFSYASNLDLNISGGYYDLIAFNYGYFALPFENLDRLIRKNSEKRLYGIFTMQPFVNTFFEFDRAFDLPNIDYINSFRDSVTPTGVTTGLAYFYMDFGPIGAAVPMVVFMAIWLWLFNNFHRYHISYTAIYSLYSAHFALISFQALILSPALYRRIIIVIIPFVLINILKTNASTKSKNFESATT